MEGYTDKLFTCFLSVIESHSQADGILGNPFSLDICANRVAPDETVRSCHQDLQGLLFFFFFFFWTETPVCIREHVQIQ